MTADALVRRGLLCAPYILHFERLLICATKVSRSCVGWRLPSAPSSSSSPFAAAVLELGSLSVFRLCSLSETSRSCMHVVKNREKPPAKAPPRATCLFSLIINAYSRSTVYENEQPWHEPCRIRAAVGLSASVEIQGSNQLCPTAPPPLGDLPPNSA